MVKIFRHLVCKLKVGIFLVATLLVISVLLVLLLSPQTGRIVYQIQLEYRNCNSQILNHIPPPTNYTGKWVQWYPLPKTSRFSEIEYSGGKKNGKEIIYYNNGKIQRMQTYKNGVLNGKASHYDRNGGLIGTYFFVDGNIVDSAPQPDKPAGDSESGEVE